MDERDMFRVEGWCGKSEGWTEIVKDLERSCGKGIEGCLRCVKLNCGE